MRKIGGGSVKCWLLLVKNGSTQNGRTEYSNGTTGCMKRKRRMIKTVRAYGNSAADAAAVKSAGETRSSRIVKYSVTSVACA